MRSHQLLLPLTFDGQVVGLILKDKAERTTNHWAFLSEGGEQNLVMGWRPISEN